MPTSLLFFVIWWSLDSDGLQAFSSSFKRFLCADLAQARAIASALNDCLIDPDANVRVQCDKHGLAPYSFDVCPVCVEDAHGDDEAEPCDCGCHGGLGGHPGCCPCKATSQSELPILFPVPQS